MGVKGLWEEVIGSDDYRKSTILGSWKFVGTMVISTYAEIKGGLVKWNINGNENEEWIELNWEIGNGGKWWKSENARSKRVSCSCCCYI